MNEKRRLERFELKVRATIEGLKTDDAPEPLDLVTSDICAGGAFFQTGNSLPEGTKVKIDLVLPLGRLRRLIREYDQAHIRVTGTVVRREPEGMAVSFNRDYSIQPQKKAASNRLI